MAETDRDRVPVIGIGASAGGIQAFQGFFENMPADSGFAFVVMLRGCQSLLLLEAITIRRGSLWPPAAPVPQQRPLGGGVVEWRRIKRANHRH